MDLFWVKTLAQSEFENGRWQLDQPEEVRSHNKMAIIGSVGEIYQDLVLALNTYNQYVRPSRQLKLIPLYNQQKNVMIGFVIMASQVQIRLERSGGKMDAILESTRNFRQHREKVHCFEAKMDALGGLSWLMDGRAVMSHEMIVKQLLHSLCSITKEASRP